jgi:hypothetical protein
VEVSSVPADICVRALLAAGFVIKRRGGGIVLLGRGPRIVVVPDIPALEGDMVTAILRSAGLHDHEFRRLVAKQSGLFTKVDLPRSRTGDQEE